MKKTFIIAQLLVSVGAFSMLAQSIDESWNYLLIREDVVNPYMTDVYEGALADISYLLEENNIDKANYFCHLHDNYRYSHITILNDPKEIISGLSSFIEEEKQTKGLIGIERPIINFTTWAESPLDYQINLADNIKILGEDATVIWEAMMDHDRNVETIEGWHLPQNSYQPGKMQYLIYVKTRSSIS